ncbi:MAG: hypothetical protein KDB32_12935, partial [Planctomycetes bacterium]|nr:hypothetical protein [Planctomycetota bacterium]
MTGRRKNWHPNWSSRAKYTALSFETPQDVAHQLGDAGLLQRHFESLVVFPPRLPRSSESLPLAHVWIDALTEAFVGPMELIRLITPRLRRGRGDLARLVLISGITSVQVMGKYAQNSAIRCAWLGA